MRKGFRRYEKMWKSLTIYEEAVSHIWLCTRSLLNFLILREIRWFVWLRNNELYRITYTLRIWNLLKFGGKIRQINHTNSSGKFRRQKIRQIRISQSVAACCLFYGCHDVIRSFSVFCSYKLEFYHERLSVFQKARIKCYFSSHCWAVEVICSWMEAAKDMPYRLPTQELLIR